MNPSSVSGEAEMGKILLLTSAGRWGLCQGAEEVLLAHTSMETAVTHEACVTALGEVAVDGCRSEIWDRCEVELAQ